MGLGAVWLLYFAECLSIVSLTILGGSRSLVGAWSLKPWTVVAGEGTGLQGHKLLAFSLSMTTGFKA